MCNLECSLNKMHTDFECGFFASKTKKTPTIQSLRGQPHPFYECITPLRCLLLKNKDPKKWAAIQVRGSSRKRYTDLSLQKTDFHVAQPKKQLDSSKGEFSS